MFKRSTTVLVVGLMMLGMLAGSAMSAPSQKKPEVDEHQTCTWQGGGWVCEDIEEDVGSHNPSKKGNNWTEETDTDTTYKGNSKNVRDETTVTCIFNPGGKLSKDSDPECFE